MRSSIRAGLRFSKTSPESAAIHLPSMKLWCLIMDPRVPYLDTCCNRPMQAVRRQRFRSRFQGGHSAVLRETMISDAGEILFGPAILALGAWHGFCISQGIR